MSATAMRACIGLVPVQNDTRAFRHRRDVRSGSLCSLLCVLRNHQSLEILGVDEGKWETITVRGCLLYALICIVVDGTLTIGKQRAHRNRWRFFRIVRVNLPVETMISHGHAEGVEAIRRSTRSQIRLF